MTIVWLIYGIIDEFRPIEDAQLTGQDSIGYVILLFPCAIIDLLVAHFLLKIV